MFTYPHTHLSHSHHTAQHHRGSSPKQNTAVGQVLPTYKKKKDQEEERILG